MKVMVDTPVWLLALTRKTQELNETENNIIQELAELINETRAEIIGPIRQEILSGIKISKPFDQLKRNLKAFPDLGIDTADYEKAAEFYNFCRKKGIQGSQIDFLICSVAYNHKLSIFTIDNDFFNYAKYIEIKIHEIRDF